jgi:hypothetical protein
VALIGAVFIGCQHYDAIVFATNTQVGARVGVDTRQVPEVQVGYNRQEGAIVPLYLAEPDDRIGVFHPTITGILQHADERLEAAEQAISGSLPSTARESVQQAHTLIGEAQGLNQKSGTKKTKSASALLTRIAQRSAELAAQNPPRASDLAVLRSLIRVELDKPALLARFEEEAKYIGMHNEQLHTREDAYSVLATFKGGGTAKAKTGANGSPSAEGSGNIAQYFATGVAAQLLAAEGGAAAVSTAPSVADAAQLDRAYRQGLEQGKSQGEILTAAAGAIWIGDSATPAQRKAKAVAVLAGVKLGSGRQLDTFADALSNMGSEAQIRNALLPYNAQHERFEANLNSLN